MKTLGPVLLAVLLVGLVVAAPSSAADFPGLVDGGSLVQPTDAGPSITVDLARTDEWDMAIRCSSRLGSPRVYYRLSASDAGAATAANQLLEVDRTFDIHVPAVRSAPLRFLLLTGEDAGVPACNVQREDPP